MEPEICTKMLKKMSEKTRLLHGKNWPPRRRLLGSFLTGSKPSRRSIAAAKRKEKEKKERGKNSTFSSKNFVLCARPSQNVTKRDSSEQKGWLSCCKCVFDQIKANLAEIQPQNHQCPKNAFFGKTLWGQWV